MFIFVILCDSAVNFCRTTALKDRIFAAAGLFVLDATAAWCDSFFYAYVQYNNNRKQPYFYIKHEFARIVQHDCFMPDNLWRSGAVYTTVPGYYAIATSRWVLTVCLPDATDCKHVEDTLLVSLLFIGLRFSEFFCSHRNTPHCPSVCLFGTTF